MKKRKETSFETLWREIETSFDWEKVLKVMFFLEIEWENLSIELLKNKAELICSHAYNRENIEMHIGGFTAVYKYDRLYLNYSIEQTHTETFQ